MSLHKQILLRYRARGHVRFQLPAQLCDATAAQRLSQSLLRVDGVYRADVYRRHGKLAVHFVEEVCPFTVLAQRLAETVTELQTLADGQAAEPGGLAAKTSKLKQKFANLKPSRWAKGKLQEGRETVQALGVLGRLGLKNKRLLGDPEKAATEFFNDVLVLYLIKAHWPLITQKWLPSPLRHRYEWMSVFYLMYLLVRSRLPKK